MRKTIFICLLCPVIALAQKEIKPNVAKAEAALQKGNLDEAKAVIDATVSSQEYMLDKKGNPAKNAAKAWYIKAIIYTCIDTTQVQKYKSLDANPFAVAKEAFAKSEELDKGKNESLVNLLYPGSQLAVPMTKKNVSANLAQGYLNKGYKLYQAKDYKNAFVEMEKVVYLLPDDTAQIKNAGVYFAAAAGEDDKAIEYINKYIAAGGTDPNAYIQQYQIYSQKKDFESALKVAKQLTAAHPDDTNYLNMEYNLYTQLNRLPEAKTLMEKRAGADTNDKESRYFIGLICNEMKDTEGTMKWMLEAVKIDPEYYEANLVIAKLIYGDAQKLRNERNALTDTKKRLELFQKIPVKLKESQVYWEKCVTSKPKEEEALYGLLSVYNDISLYDPAYESKIADLKKKMKAMGIETD